MRERAFFLSFIFVLSGWTAQASSLRTAPRAVNAQPGATGPSTIDSYGFRGVEVFAPLKGDITGVVVFMKPARLGPESYAISQRVAEEGLLVIDLDPSLFSLPKAARQCQEFSDCLVGLSAHVQKLKNLNANFLPTLLSLGVAGEFAEISWREAPQSAFSAVISVDYCPRNRSVPKLLTMQHTPWTILESPARESKCESLSSGLAALMQIEREQIKNDPRFRAGQVARWVKRRLASLEQNGGRFPAAVGRRGIEDLRPVLVESGGDGHHDAFMILYSGDGGWAEFTDELADEFTQKKIPVVGVNSMRYFWKEKSPDRGAEDLARLIRHYRDKWSASRVYLVGFSFGAGTLPFFVRRLPADLQKSIGLVGLIAPYRTAGFEFFLTDWIYDDDRGTAVMPEVRGLDARLKPVCVYPASEKKSSLCTQSPGAPLASVELPGNHHFNGATTDVAEALLKMSSSQPNPSPREPK